MLIECDQMLLRIEIQGVWWNSGVVVVFGWDLGRIVWSTPLLNLKLMWFKTFLKLSVFPTKWKTTCCFVESSGCFTLTIFWKCWKVFGFVDLTVKPKQSDVSWFQPIVSLKILTEFSFEWWICFKCFLTEYAPSLNALTNLRKI